MPKETVPRRSDQLPRNPRRARFAWIGLCASLILAIPSADAEVVDGCDFHRDGYADLVHKIEGNLYIHSGTAAGIVPSSWQMMRYNDEFVQAGGYPMPQQLFGSSVACGDFNADGFDDLATPFTWARSLAPYEEHNNTIAVFHGDGGELGKMGAGYVHSVLVGPGAYQAFPLSRVAAGDFDDDGFDDLLDGYLTQTVQGYEEAGEMWASAGGPSGIGSQTTFHQGSPGLSGSPWTYFQLGRGIVTGDFNEDGFEDGVAWFSNFGNGDGLHVFFGGAGGLPTTDQILFTAPNQSTIDFATGDFDGNGCDDLAVAVREVLEGEEDVARRVLVFEGCSYDPGVLSAAPTIVLDYDQDLDVPSNGFPIVVVADFDGDGFDDLAAGCAATGCSRIAIQPGSASGLDPSVHAPEVWGVYSPGLEAFAALPASPDAEVWEEGAGFGAGLATGDFNGDGVSDLAVGDLLRCAVLILYGEGSRGITAAGVTQLTSPDSICFGRLHQPQG
jgi:hypothetical protein